MSLENDLLGQAQGLLEQDPRRPKQSSLRRAISTGYYALFHLLVREGADRLVAGSQNNQLRNLVSRGFTHGDMKKACTAFAAGGFPDHVVQVTGGSAIPKDLQAVAAAFVDLQEARHEADYNVAERFTKSEAAELINEVEGAFEAWRRVRQKKITRLFLTGLLLWDRWKR